MVLSGCSSGLLLTALVAVLLLPAQYFVPDLSPGLDKKTTQSETSPPSAGWIDFLFLHLPPLDILFIVILLIFAFFTYMCEWIQRKVMENRLIKLNQYLGANVQRLRGWDSQQQQMEATLKMVQAATAEYNLLLYLLLRQHRRAPSGCFFDHDFDDDSPFLRNSTLDKQAVPSM